jgi:hypothetical protein
MHHVKVIGKRQSDGVIAFDVKALSPKDNRCTSSWLGSD